jgi:hypothetical protein
MTTMMTMLWAQAADTMTCSVRSTSFHFKASPNLVPPELVASASGGPDNDDGVIVFVGATCQFESN